jgi:hypothetical protein
VTGTDDTRVEWKVASGGGTVDSEGLFTAPLQEGLSTVRAASVKDAGAFAEARVTVRAAPASLLSLTLLPATRKLQVQSAARFEVQISHGTGSEQLEWRVEEGAQGGQVTSNEETAATYVAPSTPGTFHLVVSVQGRPEVSARATLTVTAEAPRATLRGNIRYTGQKTGRIYVLHAWGSGSEDSLITNVSTRVDGPGGYSLAPLEGSVRRSYVIAFMDTQGTGWLNLATDPMARVPLVVTGEDQELELTLTDPPQPPSLAELSGFPQAVGMADGLLVAFGSSRSSQGLRGELADSYRIYWSQTPGPGPDNFEGSLTVSSRHAVPGHGHLVIVPGLTAGRYYVGVAPLQGQVVGRVSTAGSSVEVGSAPGAGATLSGQVHLEAPAPGGVLYVAASQGSSVRFTRVPSPGSTVSWSIPGLADGSYQVWALLDANGDGFPEQSAPRLEARPRVTVSGTAPVSAPDLSFVPAPATVQATSLQQRTHLEPGWAQLGGIFYDFSFHAGGKRLAAVRLTGGQGLLTPYDVPGDFSAPVTSSPLGNTPLPPFALRFGATPATVIPSGTRFNAEVRYADGSTGTLAMDAPAVLPMVPLTAPVGKARTSSSPTFVWSVPSGLPASVTQRLRVYEGDPFGAPRWERVMPLSQTQVVYNDDGQARALSSGTTYYWEVVLSDGQGNIGRASELFQVQ